MDNTDQMILSLKAEGKSLRQIARKVGVSHVAVKKRLDRLTDRETVNHSDDTGMYDLGEYPDLKAVIDGVEQLLNKVEPLILTKLNMAEPSEFTIETANGWKIERVERRI